MRIQNGRPMTISLRFHFGYMIQTILLGVRALGGSSLPTLSRAALCSNLGRSRFIVCPPRGLQWPSSYPLTWWSSPLIWPWLSGTAPPPPPPPVAKKKGQGRRKNVAPHPVGDADHGGGDVVEEDAPLEDGAEDDVVEEDAPLEDGAEDAAWQEDEMEEELFHPGVGDILDHAAAMGMVDADEDEGGGEIEANAGGADDVSVVSGGGGFADFFDDEEEDEEMPHGVPDAHPVAAGAEEVPEAPAGPPPPPPPPLGDGHLPRAARRPTFPQAMHMSLNGYLRVSQTAGEEYKECMTHNSGSALV